MVPNSLDLAPKRDQLLSIDQQRVTITPEVDTISVSGSSGSIRYRQLHQDLNNAITTIQNIAHRDT